VTELEDLTSEEVEKVETTGREWYLSHRDHVKGLVKSAEGGEGYPPSGSDLFHPELWKSKHWVWFFEWYR
jgi:hypothetical protein